MNNDTDNLRDDKGQTKRTRSESGEKPQPRKRQDPQHAAHQNEDRGEAKPGTPGVKGE